MRRRATPERRRSSSIGRVRRVLPSLEGSGDAARGGAQGKAEGRVEHAPEKRDGSRADDERKVVVGGLGTQPLRWPYADQAVGSAGQLVRLQRDGPNDLGKC